MKRASPSRTRKDSPKGVADWAKNHLTDILLALPALGLFGYFVWTLNFTQDDAYISYRYVANFLAGHGLVWNVGERVEGFTNFGWVVWQILWGGLGISYIAVSKVTGVVLGGMTVYFGFKLARQVFSQPSQVWYAVVAVLLVGANASLAYWSPAGLETSAFVFSATLCLYFYIRRSWLLIASMLWVVWLRPDGAVVCGLVVLIEALVERRVPKFTLLSVVMAFVLSLPLVGFKLSYYGGILPNPFYAKTSFTVDQLAVGGAYVWKFARHYAFYGIGFLAAALFYRRLNDAARAIFWFGVGFTAYIIVIGGDVLYVHRFLLPVVIPTAVVTIASLYLGLSFLRSSGLKYLMLGIVATVLLALTWWGPKAEVQRYNNAEKSFTAKMQFTAEQMLQTDSSNFSVAVPTIGLFGYTLLGHDIIDMVGLTDSTIARYSEPPIPGMQTTWKEQKHNSRYLLTRGPDYIVFSTGAKPSAPAERALLLYPAFMNAYRTVGWYAGDPNNPARGVINPAYKKVRPIKPEELEPTYPVAYVQYYKTGLDRYTQRKWAEAIPYLDSAMQVSPDPDYVYIKYYKAFCLMMQNRFEEGYVLCNQIVAQDSTVYEAHKELFLMDTEMGNTAKAAIHERWLEKLVPWFVPRLRAFNRS